MQSYCIVGTGGRSGLFFKAVTETFVDSAELAAICDINPGRLEYWKKRIESKVGDVPAYTASDFDRMLETHEPDTVIVCTKDSEHDDYICRSLEAGCDVITEKPMTTDEVKCQKIIDTATRTGKDVRVAFNYRYAPARTQVKELLADGVIGSVISVEFQWLLDTTHGADYFRRWHRNKSGSGGLMVHKATHHFDLVNWWLSSAPVTVFARGARRFYNEKQAQKRGLTGHSRRCLDCPTADRCNFYLDIQAFDTMKQLYLDNEKYDGYHRDRCVFSDEIDIEDTMNVVVEYANGEFLSYSLNAFSPWEGYRVAFNGTKGRLEHFCRESTYISGDERPQGAFNREQSHIRVFPHFKSGYDVELRKAEGSHGGGDVVMLRDIFTPEAKDPLRRAADHVQGAYSILVGIAANKSMATGRLININGLVEGLPEPGYPPMDGLDEKIEFVPDVYRTCDGRKAMANTPLDAEAPQ